MITLITRLVVIFISVFSCWKFFLAKNEIHSPQVNEKEDVISSQRKNFKPLKPKQTDRGKRSYASDSQVIIQETSKDKKIFQDFDTSSGKTNEDPSQERETNSTSELGSNSSSTPLSTQAVSSTGLQGGMASDQDGRNVNSTPSDSSANTKQSSNNLENQKTSPSTPSTNPINLFPSITSSSLGKINCFTSIGSGSFNGPIRISLGCSEASEIRYCISEDSCCDPDAGEIYTEAVKVGIEAKTYCLSFSGQSKNTGARSEIVQSRYTFNQTLPNIEVTVNKVNYQTTQLNANLYLASSNFGEEGHVFGLVNLKGHNPGASGYNLNCKQIVEEYMDLPAPLASLLLTDNSVLPYAPTSQLNISLGPAQLVYGSNFLTAYIRKDTYHTPAYSCSTNNVTLQDFPFFQADAVNESPVVNGVREFSGGFNALGFFEQPETIDRSPAGTSVAKAEENELRSGLFAIFYQK